MILRSVREEQGEVISMKKVIAACIDLTLEFDSVEECNKYTIDLITKGQMFSVIDYEERGDGRVRVKIQKIRNTGS